MSLTNYRDVDKSRSEGAAGFQFEFHCGNCARTWKSAFKPYRKGQLANLIYQVAYYLGDRGSMHRASSDLANAGEHRARESALQVALQIAEQRYTECPQCAKAVCEYCWDERARLCESCTSKGGRSSSADRGGTADERGGNVAERGSVGGAGLACPNCQSAFGGGRFCAECGFDMASTHKSCPGCGTMCARAARFCPDCGHGF